MEVFGRLTSHRPASASIFSRRLCPEARAAVHQGDDGFFGWVERAVEYTGTSKGATTVTRIGLSNDSFLTFTTSNIILNSGEYPRTIYNYYHECSLAQVVSAGLLLAGIAYTTSGCPARTPMYTNTYSLNGVSNGTESQTIHIK